MPKVGEAGPEERTICMPDFDYGAVKQAQQVIPIRAQTFDSNVNAIRETPSRFQSERRISAQVKYHTVVSLLDKLEARKLATRKRAAADRRNVNVRLTKAGTLLLTHLAAIHHRELQQRSPEIIDALRRIRE
jgi:DNA-binding PadR family transcriptional regulator